MKTCCSNQKSRAMTLPEALVVIFVVAFLVLMLLPALMSHHGHGGQRINCVNNLKQVGLAYRIWEGDNQDKYPMEQSVTNGGSMELLSELGAWKTYQVMSNELSTPKVLYCPEDRTRIYATNFGDDLKNKISYFVGWDARESLPQMWLSGDANLLVNGSPSKSRVVELTTNINVVWNVSRHAEVETHGWLFKKKLGWGNVCLGDGSVQSIRNAGVRPWLEQTGLATNRLAIP
jgi:competence protein ComGC